MARRNGRCRLLKTDRRPAPYGATARLGRGRQCRGDLACHRRRARRLPPARPAPARRGARQPGRDDRAAAGRGPRGAGRRPARRAAARLGPLVVERGLVAERDLAHALAEALDLELVDLARRRSTRRSRGCCRAPSPSGTASCCWPVRLAAASGWRWATRPTSSPSTTSSSTPARARSWSSVAADSQVRDHIRRAWALSEDPSDTEPRGDAVRHRQRRRRGVSPSGPTSATRRSSGWSTRCSPRPCAQGASDIHVEPQRERPAHPLPRRRPAARGDDRAQAGHRRRRQPDQGHVRPRHRRAAQAAGRPGPAAGRRPRHRRAHLDAAHRARREGRHPAAQPRRQRAALGQVGLEARQLETLLAGLVAPQGLVLITGPTGSGKTNTLYSAIQQIRSAARNIVTLEDPVEISLAGINQVQVNERTGMTFARGLRAVLRQDPDIVLVGEVRDLETADLALQASLTGHLVLTTLHTNDAVSAITRLVDMGVEPFLVASSLTHGGRPATGTEAVPQLRSARTCRRPARSSCSAWARATWPARPRCTAAAAPTAARPATAAVPAVFEVLPITAAVRRVLLSTPDRAGVCAPPRGQRACCRCAPPGSPRPAAARRRTRRCCGSPTSTRATAAPAGSASARSPRTWWSARGARPPSTAATARSCTRPLEPGVAGLPVVPHAGGVTGRRVPRRSPAAGLSRRTVTNPRATRPLRVSAGRTPARRMAFGERHSGTVRHDRYSTRADHACAARADAGAAGGVAHAVDRARPDHPTARGRADRRARAAAGLVRRPGAAGRGAGPVVAHDRARRPGAALAQRAVPARRPAGA